jgi:hypothetical protein
MSDRAQAGRSVATLLACFAGPVVWAAHFSLTYAASTLICLRAAVPLREKLFFGTAVGLTLVALAALGLVAWRAIPVAAARGRQEPSGYLGWTTAALAALSALAILWAFAPAAMLSACAGFAG